MSLSFLFSKKGESAYRKPQRDEKVLVRRSSSHGRQLGGTWVSPLCSPSSKHGGARPGVLGPVAWNPGRGKESRWFIFAGSCGSVFIQAPTGINRILG